MSDNRTCWVLGVSGGADSMALLHMMKDRYRCVVAHVNYHKRDTSDRDEATVRDFCGRYNIPLVIKHYDEEGSGNFQHLARIFRYRFFKETVLHYGAEGVMVAHHQDDDLETFLFQKERKMHSDVIGLAETSELFGVLVRRPLLNMRKSEIYDYCAGHKIAYHEDESNQKLEYTRNQIRHRLSFMSENERAQLLETMDREKAVWNSRQEEIKQCIATWSTCISLSEYRIKTEQHGIHVLRTWLKHCGVDVKAFSSKYLHDIHQNILNETAFYDFSGISISSSYGEVWVGVIKPFEYKITHIKYFKTPYFELSDHGSVIEGLTVSGKDFPLIIRNAREEDVIEMPFGHKKLNRFFIDRKIPQHYRKSWVVVENSMKDIIFVSKLGCDIHHYSNIPNLYVIK